MLHLEEHLEVDSMDDSKSNNSWFLVSQYKEETLTVVRPLYLTFVVNV
jgi:hypothetical protein